MIEVKDIHKSFGGNEILKGISAVFEEGKTSLIIGQSGAGKTVFLKSLLGLHIPEKGTIVYNGKVNTEMTTKEQREWRKEIGMVFQGSALFDSQTVEENIMFPLKMFTNQSKEEMLHRVNYVLEKVRLENSSSRIIRRNAKKGSYCTGNSYES